MRLQPVLVHWIDACCTDGGWLSEEEARRKVGTLDCLTVGILYDETKDWIAVSLSYNRLPQWGTIITIPKLWIKDLQFLPEYDI